jgi:glycosyltransferase involved in cell wall biosynthesis
VIVGLPRDIDYARTVYRRCASSPALLCLDPLPPNDLHAAMRESDVVVNSSRSECCANAILEAMDVGVPVIARDIPGNRSLVDHGQTGLLFATPTDFVDQATRLLRTPTVRETLTRHANQMLHARHTLSAERAAYTTILGELEACVA